MITNIGDVKWYMITNIRDVKCNDNKIDFIIDLKTDNDVIHTYKVIAYLSSNFKLDITSENGKRKGILHWELQPDENNDLIKFIKLN